MKSIKTYLTLIFCAIIFHSSDAQDTTIIQTLTFDSTGRDYVFQFPVDTGQSYERIIMRYRMRCKGGLISTVTDRNKGCGEWDYSCNTYITDSSYTDSVKASAPSHVISAFNGTNFYYTTQPTYTYTQYTQKQIVNTSTITETMGTVGSGTDVLNHPFGTANKISKVQYLWTATELSAAGVVAGPITSIKMNVNGTANDANFLRISMKHSSKDSLDNKSPDQGGFTETYFLNTTLINGVNEFIFYNGFNWDGTSNLIVQLTFNNNVNGTNNTISGHDAGYTVGLVSTDVDHQLLFNGSGFYDLDASAFSSISDEVTISFWSYEMKMFFL
ncbi:MAG: hypothetical protein HKN22_02565 [Bacteroidia bacterium]|nr:hypothetical protein [Bacteroidia bacterium]